MTTMTNLVVASAGAAARPNIALLFLDDHGWGDFGANTGVANLTPEMDRLAAEGVRFTDFHVAASVCTPSRAALLTGRYGGRTGVTTNFAPASIHGMATTELTIANVLSDVGYACQCVHRHSKPRRPACSDRAAFAPPLRAAA